MFVLGVQHGLRIGTVRRTSVGAVPVRGRVYRCVQVMRQEHKPSKNFLQVLQRTPSDQAVNGFGRGRVRVLSRSVFVRGNFQKNLSGVWKRMGSWRCMGFGNDHQMYGIWQWCENVWDLAMVWECMGFSNDSIMYGVWQ